MGINKTFDQLNKLLGTIPVSGLLLLISCFNLSLISFVSKKKKK